MADEYNIFCSYKKNSNYNFSTNPIGKKIQLGPFKKNFTLAFGSIILVYECWTKKSLGTIYRLNDIINKDNGRYFEIEMIDKFESHLSKDEILTIPELFNLSENFDSQKEISGRIVSIERETYLEIIRRLQEKNNREDTDFIIEYTREDFINDVYIENSEIDKIIESLRIKKNIILQGAPGVGKTFLAKKLAAFFVGVIGNNQIQIIQFHENYSYEDFIMGYKPYNNGFKLQSGIFMNICNLAKRNYPKKYVLIIDEINRGNINKIFGEAFMLLDNSHRNEVISLAENISFSIPDNVYIIGTMNTADKSIAIMDIALRRRFAFYTLKPAFDLEEFEDYVNSKSETFRKLVDEIKKLNVDIENDSTLGPGYCIGHSFFCEQTENCDLQNWLENLVKFELIPLIQEYWFDNEEKFIVWEEKLQKSIQCVN